MATRPDASPTPCASVLRRGASASRTIAGYATTPLCSIPLDKGFQKRSVVAIPIWRPEPQEAGRRMLMFGARRGAEESLVNQSPDLSLSVSAPLREKCPLSRAETRRRGEWAPRGFWSAAGLVLRAVGSDRTPGRTMSSCQRLRACWLQAWPSRQAWQSRVVRRQHSVFGDA